MRKIETILRMSRSDKCVYRLKIIEFHGKYGTQATKDAFGVSKPTIYRWRSKYIKSRKDETSLMAQSTRPHHTRKAKENSQVIEFIKELRRQHRRIGKEKEGSIMILP